ncbi:MAG: pullulanase-type alpha-1,6-glucosidase [Pseudomonadota bacterium]
MHLSSSSWRQFWLVTTVALVTACGGGGGGSDGGGNTNPPPPAGISISLGTAAAVSTDACDDSGVSALAPSLSKTSARLKADSLRIHYQRTAADYDGWGLHVWNSSGTAADLTGITWATPLQAAGSDTFGQYYDIPLTDSSGTIGYLFHKGDEKDHGGADQSFVLDGSSAIWRRQGDATTYRSNPDDIPVPDSEYVRVHYKRWLGDYAGYGLHIWEVSSGNDIDTARLPDGVAIGDWANAVPFAAPMPSGSDEFGVWVDIPIKPYSSGGRGFNFLVHKGTDDAGKDGGDRLMSFANGYAIWLVEGDNRVFYERPRGDISTSNAKAYWIDERTLLWPRVDSSGTFALHYAGNGGISVADAVTGATASIALAVGNADEVSTELRDRFRHVPTPYVVLKLPDTLDDANLKKLLRTQTVLVHRGSDNTINDASTAQHAGVLDALYADTAETETLGVVVTNGAPAFHVWAPTALAVAVCVYDNGNSGSASAVHPLTLDTDTGIWRHQGSAGDLGKYYRYVVDVFVRSTGRIERNLVTDPYSVSLSANSQRSWIGSLADAGVKPAGWDAHSIAPPTAPEDLAIYELHVRDFSVKDSSVPVNHRGKYLAFTDSDSAGMQHLQSLQQSGINLIHLLPVSDILTIPELGCVEPTIPAAAADAEDQQAAVYATRDDDCFNWGYDPLHYTALEGSYATDAADATVRVKEFRQAVQALHEHGLYVAVDVVYNHTPAAGQYSDSILDRIVPGYYHRLDSSGNVTNSTCCANTATEHAMMAKLMIDSVVTLATEYKLDAFRFDIMGHQPLAAMTALQARVNSATGRPIYLYGEGWNFGEVANDARFEQATQRNLAGSGIGSFNDRLRDAARGGGAFDGGDQLVRNQGIVNGLYLDDNGSGGNKTLADLFWSSDIVRLGLVATQADVEFVTADDSLKRGDEVDYYGQGAGYTLDPQEVINYVDKHDNQTLFDINGYRLPLSATLADRVRAQTLGVGLVALAQGVPFFHAGMDILRSKSYDRDSYNSGDHFNGIDWSLLSNNYGVGAPIAEKNQDNWPLIKPRLANAAMKPDALAAQNMHAAFKELLAIRQSSTLFRLRTGDDVKTRVQFHNTGSAQVPGVIAYSIDGSGYDGANFARVVVLFNVDTSARTITVPALAGVELALHPVQANGNDAVVKTAAFNEVSGELTVPARTVAVFVESE